MNELEDTEARSPEEIDGRQALAPVGPDREDDLEIAEEAPAQIPESDPEGRPTV